MDGRSSSAMLRTTPRDSSTSFLISSSLFSAPGVSRMPDALRQVRQLHAHARQRLAHLVVQFARYGAPVVLLRIHQARGKLFQFGARGGGLLVSRAASISSATILRMLKMARIEPTAIVKPMVSIELRRNCENMSMTSCLPASSWDSLMPAI